MYTSCHFDAQVTDSVQPQMDENASAVNVPGAGIPAPHSGKTKKGLRKMVYMLCCVHDISIRLHTKVYMHVGHVLQPATIITKH